MVDLGSWPGGWLQVASREVGPKGRVVGVDLAAMDPFNNENVVAIRGDLSEASVQQRILESLGGPADVLLSDAAPKLSVVRATDRAREEALLEAIETAIPALLRSGGDLLVKLLDCPEADAFAKRLRERFQSCKTVKLAATRKGSSERYLIGRGQRGGVPPVSG